MSWASTFSMSHRGFETRVSWACSSQPNAVFRICIQFMDIDLMNHFVFARSVTEHTGNSMNSNANLNAIQEQWRGHFKRTVDCYRGSGCHCKDNSENKQLDMVCCPSKFTKLTSIHEQQMTKLGICETVTKRPRTPENQGKTTET